MAKAYALLNLLECINSNLPTNIKRLISIIKDNNYFYEDLNNELNNIV